jgi:hypothetical protein
MFDNIQFWVIFLISIVFRIETAAHWNSESTEFELIFFQKTEGCTVPEHWLSSTIMSLPFSQRKTCTKYMESVKKIM